MTDPQTLANVLPADVPEIAGNGQPFAQVMATVLSNSEIADGLFELTLDAQKIADRAGPGQFINILTDPGWDPLLRRPMSLAGANDGRVSVIYKAIGRGTLRMSAWRPGDKIDLLGPLGHGWDSDAEGYPILIGGGAGIGPILYLHKSLATAGIAHHLIMGAGTLAEHFLEHDPRSGISLTTDDGSLGIPGTVLAGLEEVLASAAAAEGPVTLFGCGPEPMLRGLKSFAATAALDCQLALESWMACGFGFCQGCAVAMQPKAGHAEPSYRTVYQLACLDGPVFNAGDLA